MPPATPKNKNRLRELREQHGLKLYEVSALVFKDQSVVRRYERGKTAIPLDVLEVLCARYDVLPDHLLGWDRDGDDVDTTDEEEAA